jgi:hypothetical protein
MKRAWMVLSMLAVANILAIAGVFAWLQSSDRLSRDRVEAVRKIFNITLAQEQRSKAEDEARTAAEKVKSAQEAKAGEPPETAADKIAEKQLQAEKELQQVLRKQQELENLRGFLLKQLADLERREKELAAGRAAFDAERKRIAEAEGSAQFKTALTTLEAQRPRDAKAVLKALLDTKQVDQVVSYLTRMDEGKRGKVLAEFVKDEPAVAADLLERMRTRGTPPAPSAAMPAAGAVPAAAGTADDTLAQGK